MVLLSLWLASAWAAGVCCLHLSRVSPARCFSPCLTLHLKTLTSPNMALIKPQSRVPASVTLVTRMPSLFLPEACPSSALKCLPVCTHISSTALGFHFLCPQRFSHCLLTPWLTDFISIPNSSSILYLCPRLWHSVTSEVNSASPSPDLTTWFAWSAGCWMSASCGFKSRLWLLFLLMCYLRGWLEAR